jgi:signal transduction histidine kinase
VADNHLAERRVLRQTEGFFDGKSPGLTLLLGAAFLAVVAVMDYLLGPRLSVALFYLMPIGLVTWNLGLRWGATTVALSTLAALWSDLLYPQFDLLPWWNAIFRFAAFLSVAVLLGTLRRIIAAQWTHLEREAAVASGLRELNEVKDTLLHAVSHDLKGPLAGILGSVQTLHSAEQIGLTDEERSTMLDMIEQGGKKMNRLVDDLLDLDRLDRGHIQPERAPTDVSELARRIAHELPGMESHPIRVEAAPVLVDVDARSSCWSRRTPTFATSDTSTSERDASSESNQAGRAVPTRTRLCESTRSPTRSSSPTRTSVGTCRAFNCSSQKKIGGRPA